MYKLLLLLVWLSCHDENYHPGNFFQLLIACSSESFPPLVILADFTHATRYPFKKSIL